jgi:hypothetical protein
MMPTLTFPSLSGTYRKRCKPTHKPNLQKEPSSPSRSNTRIESQVRNNGQCITVNIKHGLCKGLRSFRTPTQRFLYLALDAATFHIDKTL